MRTEARCVFFPSPKATKLRSHKEGSALPARNASSSQDASGRRSLCGGHRGGRHCCGTLPATPEARSGALSAGATPGARPTRLSCIPLSSNPAQLRDRVASVTGFGQEGLRLLHAGELLVAGPIRHVRRSASPCIALTPSLDTSPRRRLHRGGGGKTDKTRTSHIAAPIPREPDTRCPEGASVSCGCKDGRGKPGAEGQEGGEGEG